jgi:hypothetical protein
LHSRIIIQINSALKKISRYFVKASFYRHPKDLPACRMASLAATSGNICPNSANGSITVVGASGVTIFAGGLGSSH